MKRGGTVGEASTKAKRRWHVAPEGLMFVFVAVTMAGVGYAEIEDAYWLERRGEVVTATIVREDDPDERAGSYVDVRFTTRTGRVVEAETEVDDEVEVGQTIQVVYDRENPLRMQTADSPLDYSLGFILAGGALVLLTASLTKFWSRPP
jgi:hypothetical protein